MQEMFFLFAIILMAGAVVLFLYLSRKWGALPLQVFFASLLLILSILTLKIVDFFSLTITASTVFFPLIFLTLNIITELYGKKEAEKAIILGSIINVFFILITTILINLPPADTWKYQKELEIIFSQVPRIILASITVYVISSTINVKLFDYLKRKMKKQKLWLRKNIASIIALTIDSILFGVLAFYGTIPIFQLIVGMTVVKIALSFLDTPLIYLAKKLYKKM